MKFVNYLSHKLFWIKEYFVTTWNLRFGATLCDACQQAFGRPALNEFNQKTIQTQAEHVLVVGNEFVCRNLRRGIWWRLQISLLSHLNCRILHWIKTWRHLNLKTDILIQKLTPDIFLMSCVQNNSFVKFSWFVMSVSFFLLTAVNFERGHFFVTFKSYFLINEVTNFLHMTAVMTHAVNFILSIYFCEHKLQARALIQCSTKLDLHDVLPKNPPAGNFLAWLLNSRDCLLC